MAWVERDGFVQACDGPVVVAHLMYAAAPIDVGDCIAWIEPDRLDSEVGSPPARGRGQTQLPGCWVSLPLDPTYTDQSTASTSLP